MAWARVPQGRFGPSSEWPTIHPQQLLADASAFIGSEGPPRGLKHLEFYEDRPSGMGIVRVHI
jgi:hypothetical protein